MFPSLSIPGTVNLSYLQQITIKGESFKHLPIDQVRAGNQFLGIWVVKLPTNVHMTICSGGK